MNIRGCSLTLVWQLLLGLAVPLALLVSSAPAATAQTNQTPVWAWGTLTLWSAPAPVPVGPRLSTPTPVEDMSGVTAVSVGGGHVLVLKNDGTVWAWGDNQSGQLGTGDTSHRDTPVQVSGLTGITAVAAGMHSSYALTRDGSVWGWGSIVVDTGLRVPGSLPQPSPVQIQGLSGVTAITATIDVLALESDGTVWQSRGSVVDLSGARSQVAPEQIPGLSGVIAIAAEGGAASLALENDGSVWAWGDNSYGVLGQGDDHPFSNVPLEVPGLTDVTAIATGIWHNVALKHDGTVWAWGNNASGELGSGPAGSRSRPAPTQVPGLGLVTAIAAGQNYSLALANDGSVWSWGNNAFGQIGDGKGDTNPRLAPVRVSGLSGATTIWAGTYATESFATVGSSQTAPPTAAPTNGASPAAGGPPPDAQSPDASTAAPTPDSVAQGPASPEIGDDTLTESMRADVLSAVERANDAWATATESQDPSGLSAGVAGQELDNDRAELDKLRIQGQKRKNVNTAFAVTDVTLDAPGHAIVRTHETWYAEIYDATSGRLLQRTPSATYDETYTVEYLNGGWIVTKNDI